MYAKKWKCDKESSREDFVNICPFCSYYDTCVFIGVCRHQISEYNYKKRSKENEV